MSAHELNIWHEANQRYLLAALGVVREALERHAQSTPEHASGQTSEQSPGQSPPGNSTARRVMEETAARMSAPPALDNVCAAFGLSPFERDVLVLCAGVELDAAFATACAAASGEQRHAYPSFSLALAALPDAHWSALAPSAPLRRWRLIDVGAGESLTLSPLRIDERVLHYLAGIQHIDERLAGLVEPLRGTVELVPSHHALAALILPLWSQAAVEQLPVVQLCGGEVAGKRAVAMHVCAALGMNPCVMSAHAVPTAPGELEALGRLWEREAALGSSALVLDCDEMDASDAARERAVGQFIERTGGALIILSRERRPLRFRPAFTFDVVKPDAGEQRAVWQRSLAVAFPNLNGEVDRLVSHFSLSVQSIHAASAEALGRLSLARVETSAAAAATPVEELAPLLWDVCRVQARARLDDLAQRIEPAAAWDDLVLPVAQKQILREMAAHVRQRATVYEAWGFAAQGSRGLGISALFAGASGTGKTMAAEVLAGDLKLDLYRIDLSSVVSKYIGETEKNLRRVFDAAEEGGAILLFDEADALFGKRSEVKDSHDRYANIEVSYLLQRMEAYRGLAILTTNMRNALDTAFLRRIRFVVPFPFPDAQHRAEIWRRIFPARTPVEQLDVPTNSRGSTSRAATFATSP